MKEGWLGDYYPILFEEKASALEKTYALRDFLPGHHLVGLRCWDDFIIEDNGGSLFTVPTVPLLQDHLQTFELDLKHGELVPDEQTTGTIKWYVTPICFGGDPKVGPNVDWVNLEQHTQLVKWWNHKFRELLPRMGQA